MKRLILTGVAAAFMLAGCTAQEPSAGMTQPIASSRSQLETTAGTNAGMTDTAAVSQTEQLPNPTDVQTEADSQSGAAAETESSLPSASGGLAEDLERYCQAKAEKEAVEIEISNLEAAYRVGSLDEQSFQSQRSQLKGKEEELDWLEEQLEDGVEMYFYQNAQMPQGDLSSLLEQLSQLEAEQYQQEKQEDELKRQYRKGEITREEFISGMKENIRQEEELDVREELLEDSLERLGWDD